MFWYILYEYVSAFENGIMFWDNTILYKHRSILFIFANKSYM